MVAWKPLGMIEAFLQISSWKLYTIGWAKYVIIAFLPLSIKDIPPSSQLCSKVQTPGIILMKRRRQMLLKPPLNVTVHLSTRVKLLKETKSHTSGIYPATPTHHACPYHDSIPIEKLSTTYNKKISINYNMIYIYDEKVHVEFLYLLDGENTKQ